MNHHALRRPDASSTPSLQFDRAPSAIAYMLRALGRSPRPRAARRAPPIRATWRGHVIDRRHLGEFLRLTGLRARDGVPILYPHVLGFRLQMAILTHPAFPLPIWGALQIRNHLLQCRPIPEDAVLDLETSVAGERVLEKGVEVDLHTSVCSRGDLVWESRNTFYYRGRFGDAGPPSPLASAPVAPDADTARWRTDSSAGWRFGRLTGDYNGIHCWSWYARLFGFRRALHHPQLALGLCMARLDGPASAPVQRLDAWLKGPVYYGSDVRLSATRGPGDLTFALVPDDETRPAIVGRWRSSAEVTALRDEPLALYCRPAGGPEAR